VRGRFPCEANGAAAGVGGGCGRGRSKNGMLHTEIVLKI